MYQYRMNIGYELEPEKMYGLIQAFKPKCKLEGCTFYFDMGEREYSKYNVLHELDLFYLVQDNIYKFF